MWGGYSCSINVRQLPQIYSFVNPEKLLLSWFLPSPELLALLFFFNGSNKTAHYYQVWFEYLAEKGKVIYVFFN